ncbi:SAVED domain-containing protein [Brevundimonas diminuta]|uniref:SAVED domain-containing protein n=1 Tax=Brevundimonas diminuta TaxID=293 RepID=UPI003D9A2E69
MADAVTARWNGDKYQARVFWQNALSMLAHDSVVVEVTFEADAPKSFDDVVVRYDPPIPGSGPERVPAAYQQVKWHVDTGGRFGYEDFVDPDFIGATSVSLLQRLRDAKKTAPAGARFDFVTTYRIKDGDPLGEVQSGADKSILLGRLFDGTTDRSKMGKVRKLWREHLGLASDDDLKAVLSGLRILDGERSLEQLREDINVRAQIVGALTCSTESDFRYDGLAQALKSRKLNSFTRDALRQVLREEGILADTVPAAPPGLMIALRTFQGIAADLGGTLPENTLSLTESFNQRYLRDDRSWQGDIRPRVEAFLQDAARRSGVLRIILDAHASIAFFAGAVLDLKSGVESSLIQKGRVGSRIWRADDGTEKDAARLDSKTTTIGSGNGIALAIGISQSVDVQVLAYAGRELPGVGTLMSFSPAGGPGQQAIAGGGHAAALAEQIANEVRAVKADDPDRTVHVFAACPNSVLFYLGQQHRGIAPCIVYEFDFDRAGNKSYQPSFVID